MADEEKKLEAMIESAKAKGLEARVKKDYNMGSIMAFSGREYVRSEWRAVPPGSESAALAHPLLDVREVGGKEIHVTSKDKLAEIMSGTTPVTEEAPQMIQSDADEPLDMPATGENEPEDDSAETTKRKARRPRK